MAYEPEVAALFCKQPPIDTFRMSGKTSRWNLLQTSPTVDLCGKYNWFNPFQYPVYLCNRRYILNGPFKEPRRQSDEP